MYSADRVRAGVKWCLAVCCLAVVPHTTLAMPDAWVEFYTLYGANSIYLFNTGTKEMRLVHKCRNNPTQAAFSLDGTRLAFLDKKPDDTGSVWIVNNDGTGLRRVCATFANSTQHYNGTSTICWTQQGLFWCENTNQIFWADPETGASKVLGTLATNTTGNLFSMSLDGTRAYLRTDHNTDPHVGGLFFEVGPNVSGIVNERPFANPFWDHGSAMLCDGSAAVWVVWNCGSFGNPANCAGHQLLSLMDFTDLSAWDIVYPPDPDTTALAGPAGGPYTSPSSADHILYRRGGWDDYTCTIFNYKTGEYIDATPSPIAPGGPIDVLPRLSKQGGFWMGDLPNPHATAPSLSLDRSQVDFTAQSAADGPDTVVITNVGAGTLTPVSVVENPECSWLDVTPQGSGNGQFLVVQADASGLADGDYQCLVSVSGGGATNTASVAVRLSVGSALLPPSAVSAGTSGDIWVALDVVVTWTDNTTAEEGFAVERRSGTDDFAQIGIVPAGVTTFTDDGVDRTVTYDYRVRAYAGSDSSSYSDTASVTVPDRPITVTAPQASAVWTLGQEQHITWIASGVTNVQIDYTVDEGEAWNPITLAGGVTEGSADWGDYTWTPPVSLGAQASIQVRVAQYQDVATADYSGYFSLVAANGVSHAAQHASSGPRLTLRSNGGALRASYRTAPGHRAYLTVHDIRGRLVSRHELQGSAGTTDLSSAETRKRGPVVVRLLDVDPATSAAVTVDTRRYSGIR